jgi:zinc protease
MSHRILGSAVGLLLGVLCTRAALGGDAETKPSTPTSAAASVPRLDVEQYQLSNGLTVLLSPDRRVPIVATEILYLVGSSYEQKGRTGFAHLFEHLMFQGSAHHDSEYFTPFEPIGAEVNGTTSQDRTNYYEQVPRQFAELPLWMESDRMRSLLDVLTQEKLDNQREVVKNERRQRYEVTPYGMDHWYLAEALYPEGHPYRHTPIGSHEDLSAATLDDVRAFFRQYYVPANAAIVVAGDFDTPTMKSNIEKYFGDIPAGVRAPVPHPPTPVLAAPKHWVAEDDVELPRVYLAWHSPALFEPGDAELDLLSNVLSDGKTSRLFQRLVYDSKVAKDVVAYQMSLRLSGMYVIEATAAPGVSADSLAAALDKALGEALQTVPSESELIRAQNSYKKDFFHRVEGIGEKASLIGSYFLHTGKGNYVPEDYSRYVDAKPAGILEAAKKYLAPERRLRLDFIPGKKDVPVREVKP